jgi:GcrA cell cycle regulator
MNSSRNPSNPSPVAAHGGWSDAAVETLKALWRDPDLSAALIARRLGVTRNAVLGKIHRLGLSEPRAPKPPASRLPSTRGRRPRTRKAVAPPSRSRWASPPCDARSLDAGPPLVARLEDLPRRACHWPVGDPQASDFAFCGRSAGKGPYCTAHAAVAYRGGGVDLVELARLLGR